MGKKLGFVKKKLVTSQLQNALKPLRFKIFQKKHFFEHTSLDKEAVLKRILQNFESHPFSDHFGKPPGNAWKMLFWQVSINFQCHLMRNN